MVEVHDSAGSNPAASTEVYRSPAFMVEGYRAFTVKYADGRRATVYEHREVVERGLGRRLRDDELVHHDNEVKTDNRLDNLVLTDRSAHARHHRPEPEMIEFICPWCKKSSKKLARKVRANRKQGKGGPYCSRSCSSKDSARWRSPTEEAPGLGPG